jgi:hypothetical protein
MMGLAAAIAWCLPLGSVIDRHLNNECGNFFSKCENALSDPVNRCHH